MKPGHVLLTAVAAAGCAGSAMACSVLLDWNDFTAEDAGGGSSDGSTTPVVETGMGDRDGSENNGDSASADAAPLTPCGADMLCAPPVPSVPLGWQGPYTVFNGAPGAPPPCDPSSYEASPVFTGYEGLTAAPPTCACTCSEPQGTTCATPEITFYSDETCTTACGSAAPLTGCVAAPAAPTVPVACPTFLVGNPTPSGGTCTPSPPPAIASVTWASEAQACAPQAPQQGSCGAGEFCLSEGSGAFCIMQAGDMPCPAGEYSFSYVYYLGASDTRGCPACSCGSPSASCSFPAGVPAGIPYLGPGACVTPTGAFYANSCTPIPTVTGVELKATATLDAGTCTPSGAGAATGAAAPSGPTTFCCTR